MHISKSCISVIEQMRCVGCGNCVSVCPADCFMLKTDSAGFSTAYPKPDFTKLCKNCGLCQKLCPETQTSGKNVQISDIICYAAWHKNRDIVLKSSSGGAFYALAAAFLSTGGLVAGVAMENNRAVYQMVYSVEELEQLQGSKYIPAEITEFYPELTAALNDNKKVLISLLPCIATAFRMRFCKYIDAGQLVIIDFVCAGVPAPEYFRKEVEAKNITVHGFRKKDGIKRFWKNSNCLFGQSKDKAQNIDIPVEHSPFYNGFACNLILRKSCCNCRHAELSRAGDVTLADFWGEKRFDEQQKYGISMIMVNTNAGKKLLQAAESNLVIHPASIVDAAH